ncbi:MAG: type II restriction endonuclease [Ardenticatenaceae bacterium]
MERGFLSNYFDSYASKRLSAVEADPKVSNQHEFNGVAPLKTILGTARHQFPTKFVYLGVDEEDSITENGSVTWYDARENHPTRSEYRLYYPPTTVSAKAAEEDLLVIAKVPDGSLLVIIARSGTTFEQQIEWLFNLTDQRTKSFTVGQLQNEHDIELNFASRLILEQLGIQITETAEYLLEMLINRFGKKFPTTRVFSEFARETIQNVSAINDPDHALMAWMEREEMLFRTLEREIVEQRIRRGFYDVDSFISFSLSVQNRRKSRVGYALENHLEQIFIENAMTYSRGKRTENKAKPDFIFPSIDDYRNPNFPTNRLTMLGAKSTCKERWRQVLSEAARIKKKHLLTLEPGISQNQTNQMIAHDLQLVLPQQLHTTYHPSQQSWLINLTEFIKIVKVREST